MFDFLNPYISPQVANKMTPSRWALLCKVVIEAIQWAEVMHAGKDPEIVKKEAYDFALASYDLFVHILSDPDLAEYVKTQALPAMITGMVKTFNLSLWFKTSKPVAVGGQHNPVNPPALSQIPGPAPSILPGGRP